VSNEITCHHVQCEAQFSAGPSPRPPFVQRSFFAPQMNLNKKRLFPKVAWFLIFRSAELCFVLPSFSVSTSRWREGRWIWFPRKRVCLRLLELHGLIKSLYFVRLESPNEPISWHKRRRVIKLSVKCKLFLACSVLWPKFTPQYFLSTFAYLPILGHPARLQH